MLLSRLHCFSRRRSLLDLRYERSQEHVWHYRSRWESNNLNDTRSLKQRVICRVRPYACGPAFTARRKSHGVLTPLSIDVGVELPCRPPRFGGNVSRQWVYPDSALDTVKVRLRYTPLFLHYCNFSFSLPFLSSENVLTYWYLMVGYIVFQSCPLLFYCGWMDDNDQRGYLLSELFSLLVQRTLRVGPDIHCEAHRHQWRAMIRVSVPIILNMMAAELRREEKIKNEGGEVIT